MSGVCHRALQSRLALYDGRSTGDLEAIAAELGGSPGYLDALIDLLGRMTQRSEEAPIAIGSSWLIKHALEDGGHLARNQVERLIGALPALEDWASQLHLVQSLRYLEIPANRTKAVADWLAPLLAHERSFLRAWALDGLAHLARSDSSYDAAFSAALGKALEDDAASVRARARKLATGAR